MFDSPLVIVAVTVADAVGGREVGEGGGGKVFLTCVTMSMQRVLSPIRGPSRMGSVWAQPSYIRRNTWGKWGARERRDD